MLTRGHEIAISLTYVYTETVTRSFESHGAYVEHILFRLQGILDLDRRNTHQAQQRQKLKYDRAIRDNAYNIGEPYVPQKGSPRLIKRWSGPQNVVDVLHDCRVFILFSGEHTLRAFETCPW